MTRPSRTRLATRRRPRSGVPLACLWLAGLLAACAQPAPDAELAIENVTVYTGGDEAPFVGTVTVRDGRILDVVRGAGRPANAVNTIDGSGRYLVPGLWDMHVHVASSKDNALDLSAFLRHGVTSVRDLGGYPQDVLAAQAAIGAGEPGPTVYSALQMLNGEAFADFQRVVTTAEEADAAVAGLAALGARQVKVHRALAPKLLPAVIEAAHARDLAVTGHIPLGMHPLAACEAGMDGVEHVGSFLEAWSSVTDEGSAERALQWMESPAAAALYECLAARGIVVTPTLVVYPTVARKRSDGDELPPAFRDFVAGLARVTARLHAAGVPLVAGTDTSDLADFLPIPPGASLLEELVMLQDAGIPPAAVLRLATGNAARALGLGGESGVIAPGRAADFLLLARDPGEDVRHLREPLAVFQRGISR